MSSLRLQLVHPSSLKSSGIRPSSYHSLFMLGGTLDGQRPHEVWGCLVSADAEMSALLTDSNEITVANTANEHCWALDASG